MRNISTTAAAATISILLIRVNSYAAQAVYPYTRSEDTLNGDLNIYKCSAVCYLVLWSHYDYAEWMLFQQISGSD